MGNPRCFKCQSFHAPPVGIRCPYNRPRKTAPATARRPVESRTRIVVLPSYTKTTCSECSVGTRDNPIPRHLKNVAEFEIRVGKHGASPLCRDCAMQFAEDFASQLETLIGVDVPPAPAHTPDCAVNTGRGDNCTCWPNAV